MSAQPAPLTTGEKSQRSCLYRHFDAEGTLLYVGISLSAVERLRAHKLHSPWFDSIATMTIERFETRAEACAAERKAIRIEKPLHNIQFSGDDTEPDLPPQPLRVMRLRDVMPRVGLKKTQIYSRMALGQFPKSFKLTEHATGWYEHEIDEWVRARPRSDSTPSKPELGAKLGANRDAQPAHR